MSCAGRTGRACKRSRTARDNDDEGFLAAAVLIRDCRDVRRRGVGRD